MSSPTHPKRPVGRSPQLSLSYFAMSSNLFQDEKNRLDIDCAETKLVNAMEGRFIFATIVEHILLSGLRGFYMGADKASIYGLLTKTPRCGDNIITLQTLTALIERMAEIGLFDKQLYQQGILTSIEIQKVYFGAKIQMTPLLSNFKKALKYHEVPEAYILVKDWQSYFKGSSGEKENGNYHEPTTEPPIPATNPAIINQAESSKEIDIRSEKVMTQIVGFFTSKKVTAPYNIAEQFIAANIATKYYNTDQLYVHLNNWHNLHQTKYEKWLEKETELTYICGDQAQPMNKIAAIIKKSKGNYTQDDKSDIKTIASKINAHKPPNIVIELLYSYLKKAQIPVNKEQSG